MTTGWLFLDEQGDAKFGLGTSPDFGITCVTTSQPAALSAALDGLRYDRWANGHLAAEHGAFHARTNCMEIRKEVFGTFSTVPIDRCDMVRVAKDQLFEANRTPERLYRTVLRVLLPFVTARLTYDRLVVVAAAWPAVKNLRPVVLEALLEASAGHQAPWMGPAIVLQAPAAIHAGLQYADYFGWACHRERTKGEGDWKEYTRRSGRVISDYKPPF